MNCVLHCKAASLPRHGFPSPWTDYPSVSLHHICGSTGMSACCPSSTPFGLDLGPDLPWADYPSPGNLWLSTVWFLAILSLLMPAFSLVSRPPFTHLRATFRSGFSLKYIAPLPIIVTLFPSFGIKFSPVYLRRTTTRPVSYYALFE